MNGKQNGTGKYTDTKGITMLGTWQNGKNVKWDDISSMSDY